MREHTEVNVSSRRSINEIHKQEHQNSIHKGLT